ncbi:MAG: MYXO-CTERM sorting domain-containing protein, partial [Myxococcales bacterium]|nr:MYXO-CTERM sorting domain-containing protein [Myxococcales bacterium]
SGGSSSGGAAGSTGSGGSKAGGSSSDDGGCGCRVGTRSTPGSWFAFAAALGLLALRRRR